MPKRTDISKILIIGSICVVSTGSAFACWQIGHGYDAVQTDRLTFIYSDHGKPAKGAQFELHKANWADGAADDQSNIPPGSSKLPRWQSTILHAGVTDIKGSVDLGDVSRGKYYVVAVKVSGGEKEEIEGFPIQVAVPLSRQNSQVLWLNYYADGCTEMFATDPGVRPRFTAE
jgi:Prealbumin-like fold domain